MRCEPGIAAYCPTSSIPPSWTHVRSTTGINFDDCVCYACCRGMNTHVPIVDRLGAQRSINSCPRGESCHDATSRESFKRHAAYQDHMSIFYIYISCCYDRRHFPFKRLPTHRTGTIVVACSVRLLHPQRLSVLLGGFGVSARDSVVPAIPVW